MTERTVAQLFMTLATESSQLTMSASSRLTLINERNMDQPRLREVLVLMDAHEFLQLHLLTSSLLLPSRVEL